MTALKIMLVAGEASGDTLGAGLAAALRANAGPDGVTFVGVGGAKMAAQGVESAFDIADLSLFGIFELASAVPRVLRRIDETAQFARRERPDAVILIDSWGFTSRLAKRLRAQDPSLTLIKYVAPQVWASRPGRARSLAGMADHLLAIQPFEPPYFKAAGLPTTFVGNPVLARDYSGARPERLRQAVGASSEDPLLLVLLGSRRGEVQRLAPPFEAALAQLKAARPTLRIVAPAADSVADLVKDRLSRWPFEVHVVEGETAKLDAMRAATAALACSGTVTTELAMAGCPMIVAYRVHPLSAAVARMILRTRYITLINIAAGEAVAPEFLQDRCTGPNLAQALAPLIDDPARRQRQIEAQADALAKLGGGEGDPFDLAAKTVLDVLARKASAAAA
jgi:lipid-A-disaccharide synthase